MPAPVSAQRTRQSTSEAPSARPLIGARLAWGVVRRNAKGREFVMPTELHILAGHAKARAEQTNAYLDDTGWPAENPIVRIVRIEYREVETGETPQL